MERVFREIARDAARASGAALAHLVPVVEADGRLAPHGGAAEGPILSDREARAGLALALAAEPLPPAAAAVLGGQEDRVLVPTPLPLAAALLRAGMEGVPHSLFLEVGEPGPRVLLHLVFGTAPRPSALGALEAIGRLVAGRLAAIHLRQELTRDRLALSDLKQAKEALAGLQIAGTQLMIEADEGSIFGAVSRELSRLGLHCGVLLEAPGSDADRPELHWRLTSLPQPIQRALERATGRPLDAARIDPVRSPLVRRCLEEGRTVVSDRIRAAGRELLGGAGAAEVKALGRVLGLLRVVLSPLRREGRTIGLLVVLAPRLRPGDPEAIEAFALQASIALERARLVGALREERARLGAEVDRRTRDLRLAVEALQETDRQKTNFLANVSHELRTPLTTVVGWSDLLCSGKLGVLEPRHLTAVQAILSSGKRLEAFISELFAYSRNELTRDRLEHQPFDAGEVLSQAVVAMAPRYAARGLRLRARASGALPKLWADRDRVLQVLVNLLSNAERHSRPGGAVRLSAVRGRAGAVVLAVTDQGEGIPPEHLPRIFERLYQVRDAASPREQEAGLGLGLAIVRSIVEAHGGTVSVRSRVGRGTSFRFTLPTVDVLAER